MTMGNGEETHYAARSVCNGAKPKIGKAIRKRVGRNVPSAVKLGMEHSLFKLKHPSLLSQLDYKDIVS